MSGHSPRSCPACGCTSAAGTSAHVLLAAIVGDDLDLALDLGLLDSAGCSACTEACRARLQSTRDERRNALAARDRHDARARRLALRQHERAAQRTQAARQPAALPPAAAAALARARARASKP